jgi:hypothetical protein
MPQQSCPLQRFGSCRTVRHCPRGFQRLQGGRVRISESYWLFAAITSTKAQPLRAVCSIYDFGTELFRRLSRMARIDPEPNSCSSCDGSEFRCKAC